MRRLVSRLALAFVVVLAVGGMLLQAGSLPHVHEDHEAGFFNEEHDLTLLAGLASHVVLVDAAPTIVFAVILASLLLSSAERPALHLGRSGDSRAPPVR